MQHVVASAGLTEMRHERVGALGVVLADVCSIVRPHATVLAALEVREIRWRGCTLVFREREQAPPEHELAFQLRVVP
jgi:hypothetical protein